MPGIAVPTNLRFALAYNMKRAIAIKGIGPLLEAIPAR